MVPQRNPCQQAADPNGRARRVLDIELARALTFFQQVAQLKVELVAQVADAPRIFRIQALFLAQIDADVTLVLDDNACDAFGHHFEPFGCGSFNRQRLFEDRQRQLDTRLANLVEQFALVPVVGVDERLGNIQLFRDGIERGGFIPVGEEQMARFFKDTPPLIGRYLVFQLGRFSCFLDDVRHQFSRLEINPSLSAGCASHRLN